MLKIEKIPYKGWQNCYQLSNGLVDLIVTADVGPRIIRFGFMDEVNQFMEVEDDLGKVGSDAWRLYGGHRLWHAPEHDPRTYSSDNEQVQVEVGTDHLSVIQNIEATTGIQKEMGIHLHPEEAKVSIVHKLTNCNPWAIEFAPWALSVMAPGGKAFIPLPPRRTYDGNLLPTGSIALWSYTNLADQRWSWGEEFVILQQNENQQTPQKAGFQVVDGWTAYHRDGDLFIKSFDYDPTAIYPDKNSNVELFTNADLLEVETLGKLNTVLPQQSVEHEETWLLEKMAFEKEEKIIKIISELIKKEKSNDN